MVVCVFVCGGVRWCVSVCGESALVCVCVCNREGLQAVRSGGGSCYCSSSKEEYVCNININVNSVNSV